jgi:2-dehydro-3-deoxyphosphooctonate aldolase (KDO 8-P synthase)
VYPRHTGGVGGTLRVQIGGLTAGKGLPLVLIGGPCVIEGEAIVHRIAERLVEACAGAQVPLVFKASFDKANRTKADSFRGPGLEEGLRILSSVKRTFGIPVTTDVHEAWQAERVAEVADLLQVPAFLCRQTDLLVACARTGKPVNVKKGQFVAPRDMAHAVEKCRSAGSGGVILTERGTTFGYGDLVVDLRSIPDMAALGVPVCFDATHSCQRPGGGVSGGDRSYAPVLARAAVAAGADLVFAEIHEDPSQALSDAATQLPIGEVPPLLRQLKALRELS